MQMQRPRGCRVSVCDKYVRALHIVQIQQTIPIKSQVYRLIPA